jgi:opacity protein-like surface antigen
MKRTVLAAALLAAFSMPAFAEDAVRTDDASTTYVDPVTTSATTQAGQSDMLQATSAMKSGCLNRKTALNMM